MSLLTGRGPRKVRALLGPRGMLDTIRVGVKDGEAQSPVGMLGARVALGGKTWLCVLLLLPMSHSTFLGLSFLLCAKG